MKVQVAKSSVNHQSVVLKWIQMNPMGENNSGETVVLEAMWDARGEERNHRGRTTHYTLMAENCEPFL